MQRIHSKYTSNNFRNRKTSPQTLDFGSHFTFSQINYQNKKKLNTFSYAIPHNILKISHLCICKLKTLWKITFAEKSQGFKLKKNIFSGVWRHVGQNFWNKIRILNMFEALIANLFSNFFAKLLFILFSSLFESHTFY